jgi:hypothetical protein
MIQRLKGSITKSLFPGIFLVLLFLYFVIFNKYHILYLEQNQLFRFNLPYISDFFSLPGALPLLIGNFLTQFFIYPWIGALIITLHGFAVYLLSKYILEKHNIRSVFLPLMPVWLLTILQSNELFTFDQSVGFLLSLLFSAVYISVNSNKYRYVLFLAVWPLCYYLSGGFSIISVIICALYELLHGRQKSRYMSVVLYIIEGLAVPFILSRLLIYISAEKIYLYPLLYEFHTFSLTSLVLLYICIPLIMLTGYFLKDIASDKKWFLQGTVFKTVSGILVVFLMYLIIYRYAYNKKTELMVGIDYHVREAEWGKALELADKYPDLNNLVIYYTNLALLNSGQLGEKMFSYPQIGTKGLRLKWERNANLVFGGEIFYYLSYNNEAYRWAFEAMVARGLNPRSLKRLIITSIVNGDYEVANKYIHILGQAPFYHKSAHKYDRIISDPVLLEKDPEIRRNRNLLINKDFISNASGMNLNDLLQNHPENKTAFEYLLASLLLEKDLDAFAENIIRLKDFGYTSIPLCFEEALVFYNFYERKNIIPEGFSFRPETITRFNEYATTYTKFRSDRAAAAYALRKKHAKTYWYYLQFVNN